MKLDDVGIQKISSSKKSNLYIMSHLGMRILGDLCALGDFGLG